MAARYLKPILMELGDQSPAIFLEDADLVAAAKMCVFGGNKNTTFSSILILTAYLALFNHGQSSFSTERIFVDEKVKDAFLEELLNVAKVSVGDAVSSEGALKTHDLIAEALADGAEVLVGQNTLTSRSSLQSSIITNIKAYSRINREEIWGPCASFATFSTIDEAVQMANNTNFGLSASIFTKEYATALKMARQLEFGQVQVNASTLNVLSTAPVTGYKKSGWGSNGGGYGVEEFMFNKHVNLLL